PGRGARQARHHHDPRRTGRAGPRSRRPRLRRDAPNRCWVADFTHVKTWSATVYVAFGVDTFSRRIVGGSVDTVKETVFVLDALEMALWQRDRDQRPVWSGELIHHSDDRLSPGSTHPSSSPSIWTPPALPPPSVRSVTRTTVNALMESTIGLYKQCRGAKALRIFNSLS
ncbi:DDE-type integrase/transposase/recombinase, partial [Streptomyces sp. NPDC002547]